MMRVLANPGRWLRCRRALSRSERGLWGLLIGGSRMPAAGGPAQGPEGPNRVCARVRSWGGGGGPEEAGEFAGDGDGDDVVRLAALAHVVVGFVQTSLGAVGDLNDVVGLAVLAAREHQSDRGAAHVVPGGLD